MKRKESQGWSFEELLCWRVGKGRGVPEEDGNGDWQIKESKKEGPGNTSYNQEKSGGTSGSSRLTVGVAGRGGGRGGGEWMG